MLSRVSVQVKSVSVFFYGGSDFKFKLSSQQKQEDDLPLRVGKEAGFVQVDRLISLDDNYIDMMPRDEMMPPVHHPGYRHPKIQRYEKRNLSDYV